MDSKVCEGGGAHFCARSSLFDRNAPNFDRFLGTLPPPRALYGEMDRKIHFFLFFKQYFHFLEEVDIRILWVRYKWMRRLHQDNSPLVESIEPLGKPSEVQLSVDYDMPAQCKWSTKGRLLLI